MDQGTTLVGPISWLFLGRAGFSRRHTTGEYFRRAARSRNDWLQPLRKNSPSALQGVRFVFPDGTVEEAAEKVKKKQLLAA